MRNLIQSSDDDCNNLLSARHAAMHHMGTVGVRLRQRRKELKMTIAAVAKAADVSPSTISELEAGRSKTSTSLHRIAASLDVTTEWLAGDETKAPVSRPQRALDVGLLSDCIAGLETALQGRAVSPEKKAEIVVAIYEFYSEADVKPSRANVISFIRRVA